MSEDTVLTPGETAPAAKPNLTVTVGGASVTVEVADTAKEGENFCKRHMALTLPVNYPPLSEWLESLIFKPVD